MVASIQTLNECWGAGVVWSSVVFLDFDHKLFSQAPRASSAWPAHTLLLSILIIMAGFADRAKSILASGYETLAQAWPAKSTDEKRIQTFEEFYPLYLST